MKFLKFMAKRRWNIVDIIGVGILTHTNHWWSAIALGAIFVILSVKLERYFGVK